LDTQFVLSYFTIFYPYNNYLNNNYLILYDSSSLFSKTNTAPQKGSINHPANYILL